VTLIAGVAGVAEAQESDVALVSWGERSVVAADAFASFVGLPDERRYSTIPDPPPDGVALLVTIDTDTPLIRVWRRRDDAVLERRFDAPEDDGYALALVATELLEVARAAEAARRAPPTSPSRPTRTTGRPSPRPASREGSPRPGVGRDPSRGSP